MSATTTGLLTKEQRAMKRNAEEAKRLHDIELKQRAKSEAEIWLEERAIRRLLGERKG